MNTAKLANIVESILFVSGNEVASTTDMGSSSKAAVEFAASPADSQEIQGYQYFKRKVFRGLRYNLAGI